MLRITHPAVINIFSNPKRASAKSERVVTCIKSEDKPVKKWKNIKLHEAGIKFDSHLLRIEFGGQL